MKWKSYVVTGLIAIVAVIIYNKAKTYAPASLAAYLP